MIYLYYDSIHMKYLEKESTDGKHACGCLGLGVAWTANKLAGILGD